MLRKCFFIFIASVVSSAVFAKADDTIFTIGRIEDYDEFGESVQAEINVGDKAVYIKRKAETTWFRDIGNELDVYIDDTLYKIPVDDNEYNYDYTLTPEVLDGIKKAKKIVFVSPTLKCVFEGKNLKLLKEFFAIKLRPSTVKDYD